jgi:hypothetical protein
VKGKTFDTELNYELLFHVSILDLLTLSLINISFFWDITQYSLPYGTVPELLSNVVPGVPKQLIVHTGFPIHRRKLYTSSC